MARYELVLETLSPHAAIERVKRAGAQVRSARLLQKNVLALQVACKDVKKVFAILRSSCYNVKKVRPLGGVRALRFARRAAGLLAGAALFFALVLFFESRVLRIEIVGSGAYYRQEICAILREQGVTLLAPLPKSGGRVAQQVLALPRVSYCAVNGRGGVVTITVEVSGDALPLTQGDLTAPRGGIVEELLIVRGTPRVAVGERVEAGGVLVSCGAGNVVIARALLRVPFAQEYALQEETQVRAQAALDFGNIIQIQLEKRERGWYAEGISLCAANSNLA